MDYGQPVNTQNQPDFFTTGAGTNRENLNDFEAENNLELDNWQAGWETRDRDTRNIGNIAINAPELPKSIEDQVMPNGEKLSDLGEVDEISAVPDDIRDGQPEEEVEGKKFNQKKIRTKETLDVEGVGEVRNIINKLNQDGNVADFYDTAREMMETNLVNSYGANAAWKGGKAA